MRKALALWTALVIAALYVPVVVMAVYSFNASKYLRWTGFSLDWYRRLAENRDLGGALGNTLLLAALATVLGTLLGTMAALAARRSFRGKKLYTTLITLPVMVPDIVLAIALLSLFRATGLGLSLVTAALAHTTFTLSYVALVVSARLQGLDPSLEDAARDLGATPLQAFWKVTLPSIRPGILAGALLAFTLSFDDFVITYFTNGPESPTLPVLVYSMVRFGVTPEINALSTLILAVSLGLIAVSLKVSKLPLSGVGR